MAIANFSDLKTSIADWIDRDDLTSVIPDFIRLAEARFEKEIKVIGMIKRSTATLASDSRFLALPSGYVSMRRLQLDTNPVTHLKQVSAAVLAERFRGKTSGKPLVFTVHEEIEFNRAADKDYTVEMLHKATLTRLSSSNTDNVLLQNHPEVYLAGSMVYAGKYLHDEKLQAEWEAEYTRGRDWVNQNYETGQWSQGPVQTTVDGPTP